jgi:hypothetical protein
LSGFCGGFFAAADFLGRFFIFARHGCLLGELRMIMPDEIARAIGIYPAPNPHGGAERPARSVEKAASPIPALHGPEEMLARDGCGGG